MTECQHILVEEVEVFEDEQNQTSGDNTDNEVDFFFPLIRFFDPDSGDIIDDDRSKKNEYVLRDEVHIENATGNEKMKPPEFVWQHIKEQCHDREKQ